MLTPSVASSTALDPPEYFDQTSTSDDGASTSALRETSISALTIPFEYSGSPPINNERNVCERDSLLPRNESDLALANTKRRIRNNKNDRQSRRGVRRRIAWFGFAGGLVGGCLAVLLVCLSESPLLLLPPADGPSFWENEPSQCATTPDGTCPAVRGRYTNPVAGILAYLDLFDPRRTLQPLWNSTASRIYFNSKHRRQLSTATRHDPTLVIAGKMTVEDGACNIAQYNLKTGEWSLSQRIQLSLYNSYSGGEIYSLLANHTVQYKFNNINDDDSTSKVDDVSGVSKLSATTTSLAQVQPPTHSGGGGSSSGSSTSSNIVHQTGSGELIVVGAFDTTYRNSQVTYCSVGMWDGTELSKVGEGLCNSALSKGMKITTAALAGPKDVYVAGSFQTQVWNGDRHEFVKIFNIAHFNAIDQVWLPLNVGQITCSWCTVTVLALAWDSKRRQLHVAGKFNAIDGRNVPAGLAIYDYDSGHLVAHPGGGLSMRNSTQDGVGTALQLDEESGVLYVMGSFERLTSTHEICLGLAAYEIEADRWTCLADRQHTVLPTGGGNMLLTPYGLMVAGKTTKSSTWPDSMRPYTVALLKATFKTRKNKTDDEIEQKYHDFNWSWLPGFKGHDEPLHALANGFGTYDGTVFVAGDNLVAKWSYESKPWVGDKASRFLSDSTSIRTSSQTSTLVPVTVFLSQNNVRGAIMAIAQMMPESDGPSGSSGGGSINITIIVYCVSVGCVIGVIGAILCNRNVSSALFSSFGPDKDFKGFSLDTLTYSQVDNSSIMEAYERAMKTRYVNRPHLLTIINPQEIFLLRIIGEGTFGRVWSARWKSASVAVKEFVFAQAAVAGKSAQQGEIIEEIIGEAGMMAILRHPNVLQLFGCSLTAQAIWIVSELCSLGSLRQLLDNNDKVLPVELRLSLALQVAEGMTYLHNQDPPIIHRDLKSHNIFVHETFADNTSIASDLKIKDGSERMEPQSTVVAKIGDWGSARATMSGSRTMTHGVGTACWLAPEVIKHARSSKFSDVYGYGIVLWELATREEVYQGLETTQIIAKVANENLRPPIPQDCPWKDLMVKCWAENPLDRVEFSEIVTELNAISERVQNMQLSSAAKPTL